MKPVISKPILSVLAAGMLALSLTFPALSQVADNKYITSVLSRDVRLYNADYVELTRVKKRDFEKLLTEDHPEVEGKVLSIVSSSEAMGLYQIQVPEEMVAPDKQESGVWVTTSSVMVYPPPNVCEDSRRGDKEVSERRVAVGIGGC